MGDDPDNNFVDPFLLALTLVLTILLIFANIYFVAHYSHHADSFFGSSTACKAVLILGYCLAECQILMLPLDVQNTREGTNFQMYMMWYVVVMAALFYVTVALPFGLFYSETDEEKEFVSKAVANFYFLSLKLFLILFRFWIEMAHMLSIQESGHSSRDPCHNHFPYVRFHELHVLPSDSQTVHNGFIRGCKHR